MRVSLRPWLVASMAESANVAMNPEKIQLDQFIPFLRLLPDLSAVRSESVLRSSWTRLPGDGTCRPMCQLLLALLPLKPGKCRPNQSHMGKRLRKIPQRFPGSSIDLFPV